MNTGRTHSNLGEIIPQIRAIGRRAFEDAVAMQHLKHVAWKSMRSSPQGTVLKRLMGATGAAAVLGSAMARDIILDGTPKWLLPEVRDALDRLAGQIDDATMQQLNFDVDEKKQRPRDVARRFLRERGLLSAPK